MTIEDNQFYWAKREPGANWDVALAQVWYDEEVLFYFPMMDWAVPAFAVGDRVVKPDHLA